MPCQHQACKAWRRCVWKPNWLFTNLLNGDIPWKSRELERLYVVCTRNLIGGTTPLEMKGESPQFNENACLETGNPEWLFAQDAKPDCLSCSPWSCPCKSYNVRFGLKRCNCWCSSEENGGQTDSKSIKEHDHIIKAGLVCKITLVYSEENFLHDWFIQDWKSMNLTFLFYWSTWQQQTPLSNPPSQGAQREGPLECPAW